MTPAVRTNGGHLWLTCPYNDAERARRIAGARWHKISRQWMLPETPATAWAVHCNFPDVSGDATFAQLVAQHQSVTEHQGIRGAEDLEHPATVKTRMWKHQLRAYHFARSLTASLNAMVMGTGKSLPVVAMAAEQQRTIIICPARVVSVWPREFQKHCATPVEIIAPDGGTTRAKAELIRDKLALAHAKRVPAVVVVNYEAAWRDADTRGGLGATLLEQDWDLAVLDESHRIKAPGGRQSLFCAKLGKRARKRVCLTGTPTPHNPLDIWAQMRFLDSGVLGTSYHAFKIHYEVNPPARQGAPSWVAKQVLGYKNLDELTARVAPYIYRVGTEVLDLPPATHSVNYCTLGKEAARVYTKLANEMIAGIGNGTVTAGNALTKILRLQQITSGTVKTDAEETLRIDDAKRQALQDLLEDLSDAEPVVVFCRFRADLDAVHQTASRLNRPSYELSGRADHLATWQGLGSGGIFAVQIQSGGVGVDLTRARYSIFYSLSHSLGEFDQALARCHRPGQTRPVSHIHLVAQGTIDEQIYAALEKRREVVDYVLDQLRGGENDRRAA